MFTHRRKWNIYLTQRDNAHFKFTFYLTITCVFSLQNLNQMTQHFLDKCLLSETWKKRPCKWTVLSTGALLGNLEGAHLLGLLRETENAYLGSFSWTQRTLKGPSGTLARNGVPLSLYQWGTKGPFIRPRCIGTARARTQMLT